MIEKDKFYDLVADILSSEDVIPKKETDKLWNWFQSKQQEKIERVKGLKQKFKGNIDYGIYEEHYLDAISDVLKIMEEK